MIFFLHRYYSVLILPKKVSSTNIESFCRIIIRYIQRQWTVKNLYIFQIYINPFFFLFYIYFHRLNTL